MGKAGDNSKKAQQPRRGMLGLLVAVWLSLGLQPCLVAAAEHDCPHCPTESALDRAAHHDGHAHDAGGHEAQGHQSGAAETGPTCASIEAECCEAANAAVNARGGDDVDTPETPAYAPPPAVTGTPSPRIVAPAPHPPDPPGRSAPLNVLNCVYLK